MKSETKLAIALWLRTEADLIEAKHNDTAGTAPITSRCDMSELREWAGELEQDAPQTV